LSPTQDENDPESDRGTLRSYETCTVTGSVLHHQLQVDIYPSIEFRTLDRDLAMVSCRAGAINLVLRFISSSNESDLDRTRTATT